MRTLARGLIAICLLGIATPALAQEIVVTGSRISRGNVQVVASSMPATTLTLRRTADFAVQSVMITSDTRDATKRREEIFAMVRQALEMADRHGVQLATGDYIVEPLTLANYKNLPVADDSSGRDDSEQVTFLVKTPLAPGMDSKTALDRITKFVAAVPAVGRAEMKADGELTLTVVRPEQYRGQIVELVAKDSAENAARFGPGYAVQVTGLDRPVEWSRAGLTEVSLYLPVTYTIVPKP